MDKIDIFIKNKIFNLYNLICGKCDILLNWFVFFFLWIENFENGCWLIVKIVKFVVEVFVGEIFFMRFNEKKIGWNIGKVIYIL